MMIYTFQNPIEKVYKKIMTFNYIFFTKNDKLFSKKCAICIPINNIDIKDTILIIIGLISFYLINKFF